MPTPTPRVHEFEVTVDRERAAHSDLGGAPITRQEEWWAEHLLLGSLVRCTLTSMDYTARRAGLAASGSGKARGTVTRREEDRLYAFVAIDVSFDIDLKPAPDPLSIADLVLKAEQGCFVGNSLVARPTYHWTLNGKVVK
jgi:organic hydroperoxide reductase OsmC/OhrA